MCTRVLRWVAKRLGRGFDHPHPSNIVVKNEYSGICPVPSWPLGVDLYLYILGMCVEGQILSVSGLIPDPSLSVALQECRHSLCENYNICSLQSLEAPTRESKFYLRDRTHSGDLGHVELLQDAVSVLQILYYAVHRVVQKTLHTRCISFGL